jgi:hypothetical protein
MRSAQIKGVSLVRRAAALGLLGVLALAGSVFVDGAAAATTVRVYPSPKTHTANPGTQISVRDVNPAQLAGTVIKGEKGTVHAYEIRAHSDENGASLVPKERFISGEAVTVIFPPGLSVLGSKTGRSFDFRTAILAGGIPSVPRPNVPPGSHGYERFRTRPDIKPAAIRILTRRAGASADDIFVASQFGPAQAGNAIYAPGGGLLWYRPMPPRAWPTDFRTQTYEGKPVLTWWEGYVNRGTGVGKGMILDQNYNTPASVAYGAVHAGNHMASDLHEFRLTGRNTALITSYFPVIRDTSSVHGARRTAVLDGVVQEIDIKTGLVLLEWHSLDHVGYDESHIPPPKVDGHLWDYFHINSITENADRNLVVSGRNTWAAYKVDYRTGAVGWRLGGRKSSFRMATGTNFAWQHDVRVRADSAITLFDNEAGPPVGTQSRLIALRINVGAGTARLARRVVHSPALLAAYEGNNQTLPNGNMFSGWGQQPFFSEYDSTGHLLFDARFNAFTPTYRAYRLPWTGQPTTKPAILPVSTSGHTVTVLATWNGATQAAYWRVLAGDSPSDLDHVVRTVPKQRFETPIHATTSDPYLAVQALDGNHHVLSTSSARHR